VQNTVNDVCPSSRRAANSLDAFGHNDSYTDKGTIFLEHAPVEDARECLQISTRHDEDSAGIDTTIAPDIFDDFAKFLESAGLDATWDEEYLQMFDTVNNESTLATDMEVDDVNGIRSRHELESRHETIDDEDLFAELKPIREAKARNVDRMLSIAARVY